MIINIKKIPKTIFLVPKKGMNKNPVAKVPRILPIPETLYIFPATLPVFVMSSKLNLITSGVIRLKKMPTEKNAIKLNKVPKSGMEKLVLETISQAGSIGKTAIIETPANIKKCRMF